MQAYWLYADTTSDNRKPQMKAYHVTDEGRCCGCRAAADTVFSKIAMHLSFEPR